MKDIRKPILERYQQLVMHNADLALYDQVAAVAEEFEHCGDMREFPAALMAACLAGVNHACRSTEPNR